VGLLYGGILTLKLGGPLERHAVQCGTKLIQIILKISVRTAEILLGR
jgi:hypothetical protein